jgi:hypothetical protein
MKGHDASLDQPIIEDGRLPVELLHYVFSMLDLFLSMHCRSVNRFWKQCIPGDCSILRTSPFLSTNFRTTVEPIGTTTIVPVTLYLEVVLQG